MRSNEQPHSAWSHSSAVPRACSWHATPRLSLFAQPSGDLRRVRLKRCWCQGAKDFLRHIIIEYVWEFNNQVTFTKNIVRWLRCIETYWDARFLSHCEFLHAVSQLQIKSREPAQLQKGAPGGSGGRNPLPPPVLKTIKPSCTQTIECIVACHLKS
jgi:hypothetical protein